MPNRILAHSVLLPEMELRQFLFKPGTRTVRLVVEKQSVFEVCPRCASLSKSVYDRRTVEVRDAPLRGKNIILRIRKRRFWCRPCQKPFTEPVAGIKKGCRTTERYRADLLWACENFADLSSVRRAYRCSAGFLYKAYYAQLERKRRTRLNPWPKTLGVDEHFFKHDRRSGVRHFASVLVDYKAKRVMEVVDGKTIEQLKTSLAYIPGRENVRNVVLDLCDPFKGFVQQFFPNARLTADKFHVLRLLHPAINRHRKLITGDKRSLPVRRLLLRSAIKLTPLKRSLLLGWLRQHPALEELYHFKEALHGFYRIKGYDRAARALTAMTDRMAGSTLPEIKTLRGTLRKWRTEVLEYFRSGLTNGRTEGFNNKAKLVKRRAYGYRSFKNYRLRLLNACA